jgi:myo-inositol-1(or 4)-monophosphatase
MQRDGFDIEIKPDNSTVTSADKAVHDLLVGAIRAQFPNDCILSEEGCDPEEARQTAMRAWLIDPIDGTKLFIDGHPDYSILVGLWDTHEMTASAAAWPEHDLFLYAEKGLGCFVNDEPTQVSARRMADARLRGYGPSFRHLTNVDAPDVSGARAIVRIIEGNLDGYLMNISGTWGEHDIAFAACALAEAGGVLTDGHGESLRLNAEPRVRPDTILASNGLIHSELVALAEDLNGRA